MKNIELVKKAFENCRANCEINDDGRLEVEVNFTAYGGYLYTFGAELEIDEDVPAINFLSTWSKDGMFLDFSVNDCLESQTESDEEWNEVGSAFEAFVNEFEETYIKLAEEYTIEGKYIEEELFKDTNWNVKISETDDGYKYFFETWSDAGEDLAITGFSETWDGIVEEIKYAYENADSDDTYEDFWENRGKNGYPNGRDAIEEAIKSRKESYKELYDAVMKEN